MRRTRLTRMACGPLAALLLASACADAKDVISQEALLAQMQNGEDPVILDVRSAREYQQGHVPGAVNLPYQQIGQRLAELEQVKDREVIVYCEVGRRARIARSTLQQAGFTNVRHLAGDMAGWRRAGLPTSR
ncbi:MAG: rhodanese-like domain-containing protein [Gemmatimonadota bacterium]|nr:MAG: rhodanese-like domain-containing protein [Gemmatimonadota bacterium]